MLLHKRTECNIELEYTSTQVPSTGTFSPILIIGKNLPLVRFAVSFNQIQLCRLLKIRVKSTRKSQWSDTLYCINLGVNSYTYQLSICNKH